MCKHGPPEALRFAPHRTQPVGIIKWLLNWNSVLERLAPARLWASLPLADAPPYAPPGLPSAFSGFSRPWRLNPSGTFRSFSLISSMPVSGRVQSRQCVDRQDKAAARRASKQRQINIDNAQQRMPPATLILAATAPPSSLQPQTATMDSCNDTTTHCQDSMRLLRRHDVADPLHLLNRAISNSPAILKDPAAG